MNEKLNVNASVSFEILEDFSAFCQNPFDEIKKLLADKGYVVDLIKSEKNITGILLNNGKKFQLCAKTKLSNDGKPNSLEFYLEERN